MQTNLSLDSSRPKRNRTMGSSHSSWKLDRKGTKRARTDSDLYRKKNSAMSRPRNGRLVHKYKSESNLLEEMENRPVRVNPLYRHQEMFDNGLLFEEILAKIERQAAKLSGPERYGGSPKGFDSFMMY